MANASLLGHRITHIPSLPMLQHCNVCMSYPSRFLHSGILIYPSSSSLVFLASPPDSFQYLNWGTVALLGYNRTHTQIRGIIEHTFGLLKPCFRCLHYTGWVETAVIRMGVQNYPGLLCVAHLHLGINMILPVFQYLYMVCHWSLG